MKKYWVLAVTFIAILSTSTVIIRTTTENTDMGNVLGVDTATKEAEMRRNATLSNSKSALLERLKATPKPGKKPPQATPSGTLSTTQKESQIARLTALKLKACQDKSEQILSKAQNLHERVASAESKFTMILEKVKEYYQAKNLDLISYDELVSTIEINKASIAPLLAQAKADITEFSCTGANPAEQLKRYREDMQLVLNALHEYQKSILNLVVAIRQAHEPLPLSPTPGQQ